MRRTLRYLTTLVALQAGLFLLQASHWPEQEQDDSEDRIHFNEQGAGNVKTAPSSVIKHRHRQLENAQVGAGVTVEAQAVDETTFAKREERTRGRTRGTRKNKNSSFSACLLVMDENHRLPEWLAYHYFMLPLRHVVLLTDPRSHTSPLEIVERWRPYIAIELWNDTRVPRLSKAKQRNATTTYLVHRARQLNFYRSCGRHLKKTHHKSWVTFHDVDEYIYLDPETIPDALDRMSRPGSIQTFINDLRSNKVVTVEPPPLPLSAFERGMKQPKRVEPSPTATCFVMSRTYFGASHEQEALDRAERHHAVPSYLNPTHFETLRFTHRNLHEDRKSNGLGKSMVHVSRTKQLYFSPRNGIHHLLKNCTLGHGSQIRIRHYVGSWKAFTSRVDARLGSKRSWQFYSFYSRLGQDRPPDDNVQHWLRGFVRLMGNNQSLVEHLLQGAGQLPAPPSELSNCTWSMTPSDIAQAQRRGTPFARWLRRKYKVSQLDNGTMVASLRGSYEGNQVSERRI